MGHKNQLAVSDTCRCQKKRRENQFSIDLLRQNWDNLSKLNIWNTKLDGKSSPKKAVALWHRGEPSAKWACAARCAFVSCVSNCLSSRPACSLELSWLQSWWIGLNIGVWSQTSAVVGLAVVRMYCWEKQIEKQQKNENCYWWLPPQSIDPSWWSRLPMSLYFRSSPLCFKGWVDAVHLFSFWLTDWDQLFHFFSWCF